MTHEEIKRQKAREYQRCRREKIKSDPELRAAELEKYRAAWKKINTEEFRARRRARYAEKHKNDPMTKTRLRMQAYSKRCNEIPLAVRRAKIQAMRDIQAAERESRDF